MNPVFDYFLYPLSPVIALVAAGILVLVLECIPAMPMRALKLGVAMLGPIVSGLMICSIWKAWPIAYSSVGYAGNVVWIQQFMHSFRLDATSLSFFAGIDAFTLLSLVFMAAYFQEAEVRSEVLILTLFIASGMMLLVSADTLLMIFLALELLSLPTYVLVGIQRRDRQSCEAALKYFLFGSFATVLLVFGIALLYAEFGSLEIPVLAEGVRGVAVGGAYSRLMVFVAMALLMITIGFKVGLVPFHMWLPDTYQGAPTPVTGFMGSAIKLAGFGLAARIMWGMFIPLSATWVPLLNTLAVITMFVGNLAALQQDNLKRMWAYSSISHAGYLMLAIATLPKYGPNSTFLFYYLVVYGLMFLGFFAVLNLIERQVKSTDIYHLSGLGFSHPVLGLCLATFAFSGAGIPPTAGFFAKYFVFLEAVKAENTFFVVLAVISSLIGVYYYLRVVVYLYMKESKERLALPQTNRVAFACIIVCAVSMIYFAIMPGALGLSTLPR